MNWQPPPSHIGLLCELAVLFGGVAEDGEVVEREDQIVEVVGEVVFEEGLKEVRLCFGKEVDAALLSAHGFAALGLLGGEAAPLLH